MEDVLHWLQWSPMLCAHNNQHTTTPAPAKKAKKANWCSVYFLCVFPDETNAQTELSPPPLGTLLFNPWSCFFLSFGSPSGQRWQRLHAWPFIHPLGFLWNHASARGEMIKQSKKKHWCCCETMPPYIMALAAAKQRMAGMLGALPVDFAIAKLLISVAPSPSPHSRYNHP